MTLDLVVELLISRNNVPHLRLDARHPKSEIRSKKAEEKRQIVLANWGRRFIAWLVDYLLINIMIAYFGVEQIETGFLPPSILPNLPGLGLSIWSPLSVLIFFLYWTLTEWYFGRSIGQLLLNLRLASLEGSPVSLEASAIQSVGKSLFLPFDCLIGWVSRDCRMRRQRLFNRLSKTLVIYIGTPDRTIQDTHYAKEP